MANNEFPGLSSKEFLVMEMLLNEGEMYGLKMVESSQGELKKGTVYVTLGRMEDKGLVTSKEESRGDSEKGIARRLYSHTDYGTRIFKAQELALKYLNMGSW
ncbi:MAG: helix-turn-helix transcriptional regulator [Acidobacteria bacterium]|nr:helix-turn-helix transcriptional regulator [Acidobacteriota bacterium]